MKQLILKMIELVYEDTNDLPQETQNTVTDNGPSLEPIQRKRITSKYNLHKNSQTVKKGAAHAKKGSMKKVMKSKAAAQKWLWWSDNGKSFIATIIYIYIYISVDFTSFCNLTCIFAFTG